MVPFGEPNRAVAPKVAASALERRIGQLILLADRHSIAGRLTTAREARELILLLQDELDDLHAGRWTAHT